MKASFDHNITPRSFSKGELVLRYDVAKETLGPRKFKTLWKGPYIIKHYLLKRAYIFLELNDTCLTNPKNVLYLKKFHP